MNFKLSKLLNANVEKIKHFSTKQEIDIFIKRLIIDNNLKLDKSAIILINQLKKSKDFTNSITPKGAKSKQSFNWSNDPANKIFFISFSV